MSKITINNLKTKAETLGFTVTKNKRDMHGKGYLHNYFLDGSANGGGYCYCESVEAGVKYLEDVRFKREVEINALIAKHPNKTFDVNRFGLLDD
jgi:hypothetical protein